jgi:CRISPR-associated protein Csd2
MAVRGLFVFEHTSALGNAPAHRLFDLIRADGPPSPRGFADYSIVTPAAADLPPGVNFRRIV